MRILSKSAHYMHLVQNEERHIGQDERGVVRSVVIKPQIMLEFTRHGLTGYDYEFGLQHWGRGRSRDALDPYGSDAWGAHPDTRDGVLAGRVYAGWLPQLAFSVFDTNSLTGEAKETVEAHFTQHPEGQDYVVVTAKALVAPWPTFATMHAAKIAPMAADLGLLVEALAYEEATENRESVVASLRKRLEEAASSAAEDAALRVTQQ